MLTKHSWVLSTLVVVQNKTGTRPKASAGVLVFQSLKR